MKPFPRSNQTDAVLAIDVSGRLTYVNRRAEALTGRSRFELLGTLLSSVFQQHRHAPPQGVCALSGRAMQESRRFGPADDWVQASQDACHPVTDCYAEPIRDRYGLISGAIIVARTAGSADTLLLEQAYPASLSESR